MMPVPSKVDSLAVFCEKTSDICNNEKYHIVKCMEKDRHTLSYIIKTTDRLKKIRMEKRPRHFNVSRSIKCVLVILLFH